MFCLGWLCPNSRLFFFPLGLFFKLDSFQEVGSVSDFVMKAVRFFVLFKFTRICLNQLQINEGLFHYGFDSR